MKKITKTVANLVSRTSRTSQEIFVFFIKICVGQLGKG